MHIERVPLADGRGRKAERLLLRRHLLPPHHLDGIGWRLNRNREQTPV